MKPVSTCHPARVMIIPDELQEKHACPPVQPNAKMVVRREFVWRRLRDRRLSQAYASTGSVVNAVGTTCVVEESLRWNEQSPRGLHRACWQDLEMILTLEAEFSAATHRSRPAWLDDDEYEA